MDPIILSENEAHALYAHSSADGKALLEKKYGKDFFVTKEWTQIFERFCKANNLTVTQDSRKARTEPGYTYLPHAEPEGPEEVHDNASRMIRTMIAQRNNEKGWKANYSDPKQYRWFPIFKWTDAGLVFSNTGYGYWNSRSYAHVGAPFVFPTSEDAADFAKENLLIYRKLLQ